MIYDFYFDVKVIGLEVTNMDGASMQKLAAMALYMIGMVLIGVFFAKRAGRDPKSYLIGGRSLGPWVAAFSAEASDMSGYLLMGIPGLAYWSGLAEAGWTCIGLALGTYLNFLVVSRRLRRYSVAIDSFTIPDFFSNRFREKKKIILLIASMIIVVFFCVYAAQCLSACAKLFANVFAVPYRTMLIVSAVFVLAYTILGGFLAESVADFVQAIIMVTVLVMVLATLIIKSGGIGRLWQSVGGIDGFLSLSRISSPIEGSPLAFSPSRPYGFLSIISTLAWGLGYFGMPQVLIRFMAIRREGELKLSRRVAIIWVSVSMLAALFIGIAGRGALPLKYASNFQAENIFVDSAALYLPAFISGIAAAGVIAASVSSSDSYLLTSAGALSQCVYKGILKKDATERQVLWCSRTMLCAITLLATIIGWNSNSTIFSITSFAWAGFGAAFGPLMLFCLFYRRTTRAAAISGMLSGGLMVVVWKLWIRPLGGAFAIYELLPSFLVSCLVIFIVSQFTRNDDEKAIFSQFNCAAEGAEMVG